MATLLVQLIETLRCLPGVGPKSAQRMAFHLLERDRAGANALAETLARAMQKIGRCQRCRTFTENSLCAWCTDTSRDRSKICVVENPIDANALEQSTGYRGSYFVLMGRLSPLDGIGPAQLGLDDLRRLLAAEPIAEMIIATNPTVEGEATAQYLSQMAAQLDIAASRIAHGVPLGGELEYTDASTLAHAFAGRLVMEKQGADMSETLFVDIIEGRIPADIVLENDAVVGFRDVNPQAPHHVLFVPRKHIRTINDIGPDDAELVGQLFLAAAQYARQIGVDETGYRVVMNCNRGAGQTVFHIHLHFLAGRALSWPPG